MYNPERSESNLLYIQRLFPKRVFECQLKMTGVAVHTAHLAPRAGQPSMLVSLQFRNDPSLLTGHHRSTIRTEANHLWMPAQEDGRGSAHLAPRAGQPSMLISLQFRNDPSLLTGHHRNTIRTEANHLLRPVMCFEANTFHSCIEFIAVLGRFQLQWFRFQHTFPIPPSHFGYDSDSNTIFMNDSDSDSDSSTAYIHSDSRII